MPGPGAGSLRRKRTVTPPGPWTAAALGSKLKALWHAADLSDPAPSGWTDRVAGITLTAAGGPSWSATGFAGAFPAVSFDGVDDVFTGTALGALPTGATAGEIWLLGSQGDAPSASVRTAVQYGGGAGATDRGLYRQRVGTSRAGATNRVVNGAHSGTLFDGLHVVGGVFSGTVIDGRIDGRPFDTPKTDATSLNTGTARVSVGASNTAVTDRFWQGDIIQLAITLVLTAEERQLMEAAMLWSVNRAALLPADHPHAAAIPRL